MRPIELGLIVEIEYLYNIYADLTSDDSPMVVDTKKTSSLFIDGLLKELYDLRKEVHKCAICGALPQHLLHHWYESEEEANAASLYYENRLTRKEYKKWQTIHKEHTMPLCGSCNNVLTRQNLERHGVSVPPVSGNPSKMVIISHVLPGWDIQSEFVEEKYLR